MASDTDFQNALMRRKSSLRTVHRSKKIDLRESLVLISGKQCARFYRELGAFLLFLAFFYFALVNALLPSYAQRSSEAQVSAGQLTSIDWLTGSS